MNEKTANKKHWHVFVRKKFFLRKKFPIIDDKSVIICQQVNIFKWNFPTLCLKDRNLQSENFKLLAWVKKKLLKKPDRRGVNLPVPRMDNRVKLDKPNNFLISVNNQKVTKEGVKIFLKILFQRNHKRYSKKFPGNKKKRKTL